jgi:ubiquitin carboxyl-terminal hydrolase 34
MLYDSERRGNGGITPLVALRKGSPLRLSFFNFASDSAQRAAFHDRFELTVHSGLTCWQLKMLVAARIEMVPELLRLNLNRGDTQDRDNGKTLEELKIQYDDQIRVYKRSEEYVARVELLAKDKKLCEKSRKVFTEIFNRFASEGKMSANDCASFTRVCLGTVALPQPGRVYRARK